jgi:hypothetical protein
VKITLKIAALAALAVPCLLGIAMARDIHVPADEATLGDALKIAGRDDRVVLAPGHYHVHDVRLVDGVTVVGSPESPGSVVLDAQQRGRVLMAESLDWVKLVGLTLTGGRADGPTAYEQSGGAILASYSRVFMENVRVIDNVAVADGGGMLVIWGELDAQDCEFIGNSSPYGGGGVDIRSDSIAQFARCTFAGNTAAWGGGVSSRTGSQCWFEDSEFLDNRAVAPQEIGGAFFGDYSALVSFRGCILARNAARQGGAIRLADAVTALTSSTVVDNQAWESGGALMIRGGSLYFGRSICAFNAGASVTGELDRVVVEATNIFGNEGGDWIGALSNLREQPNNLEIDPAFCDLSTGDYHLTAESPCAEENNTAGQIGALPVGCDNVNIELREFRARLYFNEVTITWSVDEQTPYEYRLQGYLKNSPQAPAWDLEYRSDGEPGKYIATDKPDLSSGTIEYVLEARDIAGGAWFELGRVQLNPATAIPPQSLIVNRVFPNPFNPRVNIEFTLARSGHVEAAIYSLSGRRVRSLVSGDLQAGPHQLTWDSRDDAGRAQPTGTYLLKITDGERQQTAKLVLIK